MTNTSSDTSSQPRLFDFGEETSLEAEPSTHIKLWLGLASILVAALIAAVVVLVPRTSPEERAAIRAAVAKFADLNNEPQGRIYKYCVITAKPGDAGNWLVDIKRVIVPDTEGGYQITTKFKVDRQGNVESVGRVEGR